MPEIHVFDTQIVIEDEDVIHFGIVLKNQNHEKAIDIANELLKQNNIDVKVSKDNCQFCHSQEMPEEIQNEINEKGHYIHKMEGCDKLS